MNKFYIYILIDPRDGLPFYVGATSAPLKKRLAQHLRCEKRYKNEWSVVAKRNEKIESIVKSGNKLEISLLEEVGQETVNQRERYYYDKYTKGGIVLLQSKSYINYIDHIPAYKLKQ